jgi:hypothetical protein
LYSTAHQPLAQGWKDVSTASLGTVAMTGDWPEGALRRCAALVAVQVLEGCSFGVAAEAVTAASSTMAQNKDDVRGDFVMAGFPKGYATKKARERIATCAPATLSRGSLDWLEIGVSTLHLLSELCG